MPHSGFEFCWAFVFNLAGHRDADVIVPTASLSINSNVAGQLSLAPLLFESFHLALSVVFFSRAAADSNRRKRRAQTIPSLQPLAGQVVGISVRRIGRPLTL